MVDHIKKEFPAYSWVHNKTINAGCDRYRPDLSLEWPDRLLCIECDERQHVRYECDNPRMINIWQATGLPTIFLRWNPDRGSHSHHITKQARLEALADRVQYFLELPTDDLKPFVAEYMFYDPVVKDKAREELIGLLTALKI